MTNFHKCPTCENDTQTFMCRNCALVGDKRRIAGLRISADYRLVPNDYLVNALAFIHACGALEEFMDRVESNTPEITMGASVKVIHPEQVIDSHILDDYTFGRNPKLYRYSRKTR